MARTETVFSKLNNILVKDGIPKEFKRTSTYNIGGKSPVIYSTDNKEDYLRKKQQLKQQKLLSYQWVKAGIDSSQDALAGLTQVKLMYRDADLMDGEPEIGAALDIIADEACCMSSKGKILNIYSKSERIKSILEDLFVNRLDINVMLPMVVREMCKYGNSYRLLNINYDEGVTGWKQINVYEMERVEAGMDNPYISANSVDLTSNLDSLETQFIWVGHNEETPFKNWQIAHFRLLSDSFFLPYGVSYLHKARRAWRMLSMMEDAMLIYRLDKSIERRVFKIYVGTIDDQDVPAYVQQVANEFKRTPVIDPLTGQVDLRKNFMDVSTDYFIPVRTENAPTPIETLNGAQNQTSMEDIEFMQKKVFAALRMPKSFLNFEEDAKGQNLSILDIRFCRMVNRVQQYLLMELNKIATIHLYLLGFEDDLTNFSLTMNNPSTQLETTELEDLSKRIQTAQSALSDPGNGIQIWSLHRVCKEILKMTDKEIADNLNEIRLEKALAAELAKTEQIIKRTGFFDTVDRIYGEIGAEYQEGQPGADMGGMGGMGGGAPLGGFGGDLGGDMGGDLGMDDLGSPGEDLGSPIGGTSGTTDMGSAPSVDTGLPVEGSKKNKPLLTENKTKIGKLKKSFMEQYLDLLSKSSENDTVEKIRESKADIINDGLIINEEMNGILDDLSEKLEKISEE